MTFHYSRAAIKFHCARDKRQRKTFQQSVKAYRRFPGKVQYMRASRGAGLSKKQSRPRRRKTGGVLIISQVNCFTGRDASPRARGARDAPGQPRPDIAASTESHSTDNAPARLPHKSFTCGPGAYARHTYVHARGHRRPLSGASRAAPGAINLALGFFRPRRARFARSIAPIRGEPLARSPAARPSRVLFSRAFLLQREPSAPSSH